MTKLEILRCVTEHRTSLRPSVLALLDMILCHFQVGKEFDALLVDVQAPNSTHPVFDVFQKDTFDVSMQSYYYSLT